MLAPADPSAVAAAGVLGGAIGGAIAGAATSGGRKKFIIDIHTGNVSSFDINGYEGRVNSDRIAKIILYCKDTKVMSDNRLVINLLSGKDSMHVELKHNTYIEVEWADLLSEVTVCVASSNKACYSFLPKVDKNNYIELVYHKNAATPRASSGERSCILY